jgi:hypothetical protein
MTQGINSALTHLEDKLMEITPKSDTHHGFVALARAGGSTIPLSQRSHSTRYFELAISAEDAESLLVKLKGPEYDFTNTGIVSVIPEPPSVLPVDPVNDTGALLLTIPFILLYLEA